MIEIEQASGAIDEMGRRLRDYRVKIAEMQEQIGVLRGALLVIEEWRSPYSTMAVDVGSNGQRDYFRDVARKALAFKRAP